MPSLLDVLNEHNHGREYWVAPAVSPSGEVTIAAMANTKTTTWAGGAPQNVGIGFQVNAGNNAFGTWTQILGSGDTAVYGGLAMYDCHRFLITAAQRTSPYLIQLGTGNGGAQVEVSAFMYAPVGASGEQTPIVVQFPRQLSGTKLWVRTLCAGQNLGTIDFLYGLHGYDDTQEYDIPFSEGAGAGMVLSLERLTIATSDASNPAVLIQQGGTGGQNAVTIQSTSEGSGGTGIGIETDASGVNIQSLVEGNGVTIQGAGAGHGILATGGATGDGIQGAGGATSGQGIKGIATSGHGIMADGGGAGNGIHAVSGGGATGDGIKAISAATDGNGLSATGVGTGAGVFATSGGSSGAAAIVAFGTGSNGIGLNAIGAGSGAGLKTTGGNTSAPGIFCLGGSDGDGAVFRSGIGGALGDGVRIESVSTNGNGVSSTGAGTGHGMSLIKGAGGKDLDADEIDNIKTDTGTLINRIGAWTGTGVNTILGAFKALLSKIASLPSDIGGTGNPATDSNEALREITDQIAGTGFVADTHSLKNIKDSAAATQAKLPSKAYLSGSADSDGGLDTEAKADINTEVDSALNTAIPGSPTLNSVNERIKAMDTRLPGLRS